MLARNVALVVRKTPPCLLLLCVCATCVSQLILLTVDTHAGSGLLCTFKDKTYSPGDSWHPHLNPFGLMFCMRCVCTEVLVQPLFQTFTLRKISRVKVCLQSVWIYIVFFAERPREMQHNQVSCFVVWEPSSRASAVLSKMHRSALHCLYKERETIKDAHRADFLCPLQVIRSESPQDSELLSNPADTTELFINRERPSTSVTSSHPSRVTSVLCAHVLWVSIFFYILFIWPNSMCQEKNKLQEPKLNRPEACFQDF